MTLPVVFTANGSQGYNLTNSLRFRSSASAYLNRTPSVAGNQKTFTISMWVKRGSINSGYQDLFEGYTPSSGYANLQFTSNDNLTWYNQDASTVYLSLVTTQVFRDPSAWYHIVANYDSTQATASNRAKLYVNGTQITSFTTATYPSQNVNSIINGNVSHFIGKYGGNLNYFDGYLAEVNFIDGQALTPSSFGATNPATGVWQPAKYTGTYGTNGFYLPFTDNSALTTSSNAGLGKDFSGNGNYWTTNNISITSGSTYDSMTDVPTLTSADAANYAVLNPLSATYAATITNANLNVQFTNSGNSSGAGSTIAMSSGKWYAEMTITATAAGTRTYPLFGICNPKTFINPEFLGDGSDEYSYSCDGYKTNNNSATSVGTTFTTNDVMMMAFDATDGKLWWGKNGTWIASGDPSAGTNAMYSSIPSNSYIMAICGFNNASAVINFGQRPFAYTPPTGFKALNTFNLPTPTIGATATTQADDYFNAVLYSGNNSTQNIAVGFQPDFVWSKCRNVARSHRLSDAVRGSTRDLYSDTTSAEQNDGSITSFISTGFSLDNSTGSAYNTSGENYVSWAWKANGSGSSNTQGSITSTVSANTSAGFSIVTYTGTGSASDTVGHGLGVTPAMVITKRRSSGSGAFNWMVKHSFLSSNNNLLLESTGAQTNVTTGFGSGGIADLSSSTTFGFLNGTSGNPNNSNTSGATYVAYCFAQIAGYSAFGSYTGNGSSDGPFVFTGFRPRFVLVKRTDTTGNWSITDTAINPYNNTTGALRPNTSDSESTVGTVYVQPLSNGFKITNNNTDTNASSGTYIYACFAESPFKYANAR